MPAKYMSSTTSHAWLLCVDLMLADPDAVSLRRLQETDQTLRGVVRAGLRSKLQVPDARGEWKRLESLALLLVLTVRCPANATRLDVARFIVQDAVAWMLAVKKGLARSHGLSSNRTKARLFAVALARRLSCDCGPGKRAMRWQRQAVFDKTVARCYNALYAGIGDSGSTHSAVGALCRREGGLEWSHSKRGRQNATRNGKQRGLTEMRGAGATWPSSALGLYASEGSVLTVLERLCVIKAFVMAQEIHHDWDSCQDLLCVRKRLKFDVHFGFAECAFVSVMAEFALPLGCKDMLIKTNGVSFVQNGSFAKEKRLMMHR